MTELNFKMATAGFCILLISAPTLEVTFQMLTHFGHPWPIGKKKGYTLMY